MTGEPTTEGAPELEAGTGRSRNGKGLIWTKVEDARLLAGRAAGRKVAAMAPEFAGRTLGAVRQRLRILGAAGEVPEGGNCKRRTCLKCRETFISRWPGERVCELCKSTPTWRDGYADCSLGNAR